MHAHLEQHPFENRLAGVFRHNVRWVVRTQDFDELNNTRAHFGLRPKIGHAQVADLVQASASTHAKRSNYTAMDSGIGIQGL